MPEFVPPPDPSHTQFHGPVPETAVAVPAAHNPATGATLTTVPFAAPHAPFTATAPVTVKLASDSIAPLPRGS